MAVWPFGRKNKNAEEPEAPAEDTQLDADAAYESSDVDLDDDWVDQTTAILVHGVAL